MELTGKRIEQFNQGLSKLFYFIMRFGISLALGYFSSKCTLFDDLSPFSLILLSCCYRMGLMPTFLYLGSTFGYLTLPFNIYIFKYITAMTMVYTAHILFCRSLHLINGDMAVISASSHLISGFLFLLVGEMNLFSVLLLIAESVLICCCIYFVTYAVKGFKKNCYLTSREIIAAAVTLILVLVSLHDIYFFQLSIARILGLMVIFMGLNCLKISHVAVLGSCVGIILAAVGNGGETVFSAFVVSTLIGCVFSTFSVRFAELSLVVAYYAVLVFYGKFPWGFLLFAEPIVAYSAAFFIPKEKLKLFLSAYISVRKTKRKEKEGEKLRRIIEECRQECESFCPKTNGCYQKNAEIMIEIAEELIERYHQTEEIGNIEDQLSFCIKPKAMSAILSRRLLFSSADDFEELVNQLNRVSQKMEMKMEASVRPVRFLGDEEIEIKKSLTKRNISVKEITFIVDEHDCRRCEVLFECPNDLLYEKILKEILGRFFYGSFAVNFSDLGGVIRAYAIETDKFRISCAAICRTKDGEDCCGDHAVGFSVGKGIYYLLLSDGMGSGKAAGIQSETAIDIFRKLLSGGLSVQGAYDAYCSAERLRYQYGFTTIDLCKIDLSKGIADFYKAGAFDSFCIKRDKVIRIHGGGMPPTLCGGDKMMHKSVKLTNGDYLVMASDGLASLDKSLESILLDCEHEDLRVYARNILKKSSLSSEGIADDDSTVIVAKIYNSQE